MRRRYIPAGSTVVANDPVVLTADEAGWTYCGLRVIGLEPGETRTLSSDDTELFVLPLSATELTVNSVSRPM
jgi:5-deoxy-glucuronate isomerase